MFQKMPVANRSEFDTSSIETTTTAEDATRERPERRIALIAAAIKAYRRDKERAREVVGSGVASQGGHPWRTSLRRYW